MHNEEDTEEYPQEAEPTGAEAEGAEAASVGVRAGVGYGIVGIRFEPCGKVYCFRADGLRLKLGERVVVESDLGMSIGRVVIEDYTPGDAEKELKPVLRRVTEEDLEKERENFALKREALDFCNERIMARGLAMKLLSTDVTLDRRRIIFFFSAETRIDFRELVKDLAAKFRTRIELRQVGVRDAARITGGIGICGRELCCRRFLTSFDPISIKMAKKQDLTLNTSKLSGVCGRLMCCLGYEYDEKRSERRPRGRDREGAGEKPRAKEPQVEAVPAEQVEEAATVVVEPPPVEAPRPEEKTKRRRRRPRGRRRKPRAEGQVEAAGGDALPQARRAERTAEPSAPREGRPPEKAEGGQVRERQGEERPSRKPFKKKRRRRMRGKKKE
ncbi:MAG: regulatory iron-sulfur-containing complex subunit RicT [Nitrospirota bacterium]